jgi:hypothetical protein
MSSGAGLAAEKSRCDNLHNEWKHCLNKSGRNPAKCTALEGDIRKCAVSIGQSFCIDETVSLMNCSRSPNDTSLCADQFIAMRECNRPRGPLVVKNDKGVYRMLESSNSNEFSDNASRLLAQANPPTDRSAEGMRKAANEYAATVGIADLADIRF